MTAVILIIKSLAQRFGVLGCRRSNSNARNLLTVNRCIFSCRLNAAGMSDSQTTAGRVPDRWSRDAEGMSSHVGVGSRDVLK